MLLLVHGEAGDPHVRLAANIDYDIHFIVSVDVDNSRVLVGLFGKVDEFPAFEAYANFNGVTKTLFQLSPPTGNDVVNLLGLANVPVAAAASFP